jgi:hypothetical protein
LSPGQVPKMYDDDPGGPVESGFVQGSTLVMKGTRDFLKRAYEMVGREDKAQ